MNECADHGLKLVNQFPALLGFHLFVLSVIFLLMIFLSS